MAKERRCPHCGKNTRTTGDFCPWCSKPMVITPDSENLVVLQTKEKKTIKKIIGGIIMKIRNWPWRRTGFIAAALIATVLFVYFFKSFANSWPGIVALCGLGTIIVGCSILFLNETKKEFLANDATEIGHWLNCLGVIALAVALIFGVLIPNLNPTSTSNTTDETSITVAPDYYVGVPANADDINNNVWNQPYADAVMVGTDGTTSVYTQSGKDGSSELSGLLPVNVALVIDSYNLTVNGKSYTNGNLLVIVNDSDTEKDIANYGISYTNGAAQLISTSNLQKLLDSNIAVKFSRGDWSKEKNQWSYSPWALNNLWIPEGYTYTPLKLDYESDTYPNRDLATDTSVNTSGATTK